MVKQFKHLISLSLSFLTGLVPGAVVRFEVARFLLFIVREKRSDDFDPISWIAVDADAHLIVGNHALSRRLAMGRGRVRGGRVRGGGRVSGRI